MIKYDWIVLGREEKMGLLIWVLIAVFVLKLFLPQIKGMLGERAVSGILSRLPEEEYHTINNVMLKTETGTSQVDHIVVSIYGIFVIETKNYKGWITGTEYSSQWTKNMYGKKYPFRNPIKQNYGHVKALENMLGLSQDFFIPIVVFSIAADLKVKTESAVIYTSQLLRTIQSHTTVKMGRAEVTRIVSRITSANIDSKENRKKHVQTIRDNVTREQQTVRMGICPKCGGELKMRKGKYGTFWGCSNYPKCKYTKG